MHFPSNRPRSNPNYVRVNAHDIRKSIASIIKRSRRRYRLERLPPAFLAEQGLIKGGVVSPGLGGLLKLKTKRASREK